MTDETQGAAEAVSDDTAPAIDVQVQDQTEQSAEDTSGDDPAAPAADEGQGEQPKPKKTAKERIDQLTWEKHELARQNQELLDRLAGKQPAPAQAAQPAQAKDDEPDPEEYEHGVNDLAYIKDVARYEARQEFRQQAEQERAQATVRSRISAFEAKASELFPDGEPAGLSAFKENAGQLHMAAQEVIAEADIGPKVAEYLGSNPREMQRISALPPAQQVRQVTLLEARLTAPAAQPAPKIATEAPEPPPRPRGASGQFKVAPDTDDFAAFEKQYGG